MANSVVLVNRPLKNSICYAVIGAVGEIPGPEGSDTERIEDDPVECFESACSGGSGESADAACVIDTPDVADANDETSVCELDSDVKTAVAVLLALKWHGDVSEIPAMTPKASKKRGYASEEYLCARCGTSKTPLWRKPPGTDTKLCNACGIYLKTHGKQRPMKWFRFN